MQYQHILVAIDYSDHAKKTLEKAQEVSKIHGAKLTLAHFVEPLPATAFSYASAIDVDKKRLATSKEKLASIGQDLEIPEQDQYIEEAIPKHGIVKLAKQLGVDLIVIGSQGHSPILNLLGSTAHAVTSHATCDVLVVK